MARALALAVIVMLPRLASPQFGLLDDGLTLLTGREVHGRWANVLYLIPETGRFFPAYWLVYSAIWSLAGVRPLAFFAVNVLLFASLIAMLARLVRLSGGTPVAAAVAAVLFGLSGPAIETFYTLSKAEPLQATWIGVSLLATAASARQARWSMARVGWLTLAAATGLLAHATKETSVILIPIALGWLALEWARPRDGWGARFAASYAAVTALAAVGFVALRWQYAALPLGEGTYTRAYALQSVGPALFRIAAWLLRDFAWLLPLLATALVLVARGGGARRPILYAGMWMVGWLLVYLPWPATFEYYLLPFALGAAALAGAVVGETWARQSRLAWSLLVATALLWSVALVNAYVDARVQLAVDRANADVVDFLGTLPPGSHVVLNMTPVNEYHFELPMHLGEIKQRPDVVFRERRERWNLGGPAVAHTFVLTPEMTNQPGPTVRIALHEAGVRGDNAALASLLPGGGEPVYRTAQRIGILEIGLHRLLCPLGVGPVFDPTYCPHDRGLIFRRTFAYGWQVHRVVRPAANAATMSACGSTSSCRSTTRSRSWPSSTGGSCTSSPRSGASTPCASTTSTTAP
jgi:hypothetical protein